METTKRCSRCGRILPLSAFSKKSDSLDGVQSYCTECVHEYNENKKRAKAFAMPAFDPEEPMVELAPEAVAKKPQKEPQMPKMDPVEALMAYTPRDLMKALYLKGYRGKLTYTEVRTVNLDTILE